jgi:hypothetical protein
MPPESKEQKDLNQRILTITGVSVVLGILCGQLLDFDDLSHIRMISITGHGPFSDLLVILGALIFIIAGSRLTVLMGTKGLLVLGTLLVLGALFGPNLFARYVGRELPSPPFLQLAVIEFIGAALVGSGLRQLLRTRDSKSQPTNRGDK